MIQFRTNISNETARMSVAGGFLTYAKFRDGKPTHRQGIPLNRITDLVITDGVVKIERENGSNRPEIVTIQCRDAENTPSLIEMCELLSGAPKEPEEPPQPDETPEQREARELKEIEDQIAAEQAAKAAEANGAD